MGLQLLIGGLAITLTVIVQVIVMKVLALFYRHRQRWLHGRNRVIRQALAMIFSVLWLVLGITINTWGWAWVYILIGEFQQWEPAVYFALASFTTLGYGDLVLSHDWRILGALSAVNGMIIFGLNTAMLIDLIIKTWGNTQSLE